MNYSLLAYGISGVFGLIILLSIWFSIHSKGRKAFIFALYTILFIYTIGQSVYYSRVLPGTSPDETAHISYIVYLRDTNAIIPKYEEMGLLSSALDWSQEETWYKYIDYLPNYVCHPPLYYQIMRLAGGIGDTANYHLYTLDKYRMRYFSLGIFAIGLFIMLYIGYTRIDKDKAWLHLLYATACTSIPMMNFEGAAVTNDTLALVTGCLSILGLLRFCEKKRNYLTYIIIAVGLTASLLTKMTTAMLCIVMAVIVLLITMIKERSIKNSLGKEFLVTIPIYCIALVYYAIIYHNYGTIQVSLEMICSKEYFESTVYYVAPELRENFDFAQFSANYFSCFFKSWTGIVSTYGNFLKVNVLTKTSLALEALWFMPLLILIPKFYKSSDNYRLPILAGFISCVFTVLLQYKSAWKVYLTRGYLGGNQARYYIPFMIIFAMALVHIFKACLVTDEGRGKARILLNHLVYLIALVFTFVMFYANFPFFLNHFGEYVSIANLVE